MNYQRGDIVIYAGLPYEVTESGEDAVCLKYGTETFKVCVDTVKAARPTMNGQYARHVDATVAGQVSMVNELTCRINGIIHNVTGAIRTVEPVVTSYMKGDYVHYRGYVCTVLGHAAKVSIMLGSENLIVDESELKPCVCSAGNYVRCKGTDVRGVLTMISGQLYFNAKPATASNFIPCKEISAFKYEPGDLFIYEGCTGTVENYCCGVYNTSLGIIRPGDMQPKRPVVGTRCRFGARFHMVTGMAFGKAELDSTGDYVGIDNLIQVAPVKQFPVETTITKESKVIANVKAPVTEAEKSGLAASIEDMEKSKKLAAKLEYDKALAEYFGLDQAHKRFHELEGILGIDEAVRKRIGL